jgi:putative ABC transport system substrate-binding protein
LVEGQNVAIEYRYADNQTDRLPALLTDLIRRPVGVIVANTRAALAAKTATTTVPIVFATGGDPVSDGLVASLNRPGGNVTGVVFFASQVGAKRLELLRLLVPKGTTIGLLVNPNNPNTEAERRELTTTAASIGQQLVTLDVNGAADIDAAFSTFIQRGVGAVYAGGGAFINSHRERIIALAARHRLPTSYPLREQTVIGGLMSYGPSQNDAYRQVGVYAGRILKGEKPADLPVMRATKFDLVINVKTAKAAGLDIPDRVLALADEVIE